MISVSKKLKVPSILICFLMFYIVKASEEEVLDYSEKNWPLVCQSGNRQSPVDMPQNFTYNTTDHISIISSNYSLINSVGLGIQNHHKFYVQNISNAGPLMVKKAGITYQYDLADIHFHVTSEHTIKGIPSDIEMHLVHKKNIAYLNSTGVFTDPDVQNSLLVIGIMFRADVAQDNLNFAKFDFNNLGPISNLNSNNYVSSAKSFYHYLGGLTTPTCDEIVNWVVMEAMESISPAQLQAVKKFISPVYPAGNARSVKNLFGRTIYYRDARAVNTLVKVQSSGAHLFMDKLIIAFALLFIILF